MNLNLIKSLWGIHPEPPYAGNEEEKSAYWKSLFSSLESEGYVAVEAISLTYNESVFVTCLQASGLKLVAQVHTSGGFLDEKGYNYLTSCVVEDHLVSLECQLNELAPLHAAGLLLFVNLHSGHGECWNNTPLSTQYFELVRALQTEKFPTWTLLHETHRQRLLSNPTSYQYAVSACQPNASSSHPLLVTADLSHWVVCGERVFDAKDKRDADWWPKVLKDLGQRVVLIHARVGHEEGPQLPDPREREHESTVNAHLDWWGEIWKAQKERGMVDTYVTTEFGPKPYMPQRVGGGDVAVLKDINRWIKNKVVVRFNELFGGEGLTPVLLSAAKAKPSTLPPASSFAAPVILSEFEVRQTASPEIAYAAAVRAFTAISAKAVSIPFPQQLSFPAHSGSTCIKSAFVENSKYYCVKIASSFAANATSSLPTNSGSMILFSSQTGSIAAVLADNGYLTDLRTGSAGALAAKTLCRTYSDSGSVERLAIIGGGAQAYYQCAAICRVLDVKSVACYARSGCAGLQSSMKTLHGVDVVSCASVKDALKGADLIVTTTASCEPLVLLEHLDVKKHCVIVAVGSDAPGKREIGPCVVEHILSSGGSIIADKREQALRLGECQYHGAALEMEGAIKELGDVVTGQCEVSKEGILLVDLTGVGAQDSEIAAAVFEAWSTRF